MKKRILALALALVMLASTVTMAQAAYGTKEKTADALNQLGLILGNGSSYNLNGLMQRDAGTTMLIRMLGAEKAAQSGGDFGMPFYDVPNWAKGYIGYGWKHKIVNGVSADRFAPTGTMTDYMFLTLTLRALGYQDSGANAQFVWNDPYALAKEVGLITSTASDSHFTRGEAILIFWNALEADLVGKSMTLSDSLIRQGIFTASEYEDAKDIQKNGRQENQGQPVLPEEPETPVEPEQPEQPEQPEAPADKLTYEEYQALSGAEQMEYMNSFAAVEDFFAWYNEAKAKYDEEQNRIEIGGDGSIDLDDIINGKN